MNELLARLRVAMRHAQTPQDEIQEFRNGDLVVDVVGRNVKIRGEAVKLTATEHSLLLQFVKNAGTVLSHRHLMKEVWGPHRTDEVQTLRVHMAQIRKKLEKDPSSPRLSVTESGVGYRMPLLDEE